MAHQFESGIFAHKAAWHGLGIVLDHHPSIEDALVLAGLDWEVGKLPLYAKLADGEAIEVAGHKAIVRESDSSVLGVVTDQYVPLQNKQAFEVFAPLVDDGTLKIETAGSLMGGRKVWIQCAYTDPVEIIPGDLIKPYVALATGHDGGMSVRIKDTSIRVVCNNTAEMAGFTLDGDAEGQRGATDFAIAHVGDVLGKSKAARDTIEAMRKQAIETVKLYRAMSVQPVNDEFVRKLVKEVFDQDYQRAVKLIAKFRQREEMADVHLREDTRRAIAELEKMLDKESRIERQIVDAFHNAPGADIAGETAWGAFNAATYYIDHLSGGGNGNGADRRLTSSWFGAGAQKRRKALSLVAEAVR